MQENIPSKAKSCIKLVKLVQPSQNKYKLIPVYSEHLDGTLWCLIKATIDDHSLLLACINKNISFFDISPDSRIKLIQSASFDYPIQAVEYRANKLFITFFCAQNQVHYIWMQDGQIMTGLVCCDYTNSQSHYAFPVSDSEFLVSCRNG